MIVTAAILLPVLLTGCGKKGRRAKRKPFKKVRMTFKTKTSNQMNANIFWRRNLFYRRRQPKIRGRLRVLSSHAKARMSLEQFKPAEQDPDSQQNQTYAFDNVTAEQFAYLMQYVEAAHGAPRAPKMLHVFSTDPDVLNRRSKEQFGAMDSMFAIGAMPEWIPADIRRASLRGQIHTELSPQELQNEAQREGISVEDLKKTRISIPTSTSRSFSSMKVAN